MSGSFKASVDAWAQKSRARMEAIFKQSAQEVVIESQKVRARGGNMRVDIIHNMALSVRLVG